MTSPQGVNPFTPEDVPIRELEDHSHGQPGTLVTFTPTDVQTPEAVQAWLEQLWPVTIERDCHFPVSMPHRLAAFTTKDRSGLETLPTQIPN